MLPLVSVAVQRTMVVPMGNSAGALLVTPATPQLSATEGKPSVGRAMDRRHAGVGHGDVLKAKRKIAATICPCPCARSNPDRELRWRIAGDNPAATAGSSDGWRAEADVGGEARAGARVDR